MPCSYSGGLSGEGMSGMPDDDCLIGIRVFLLFAEPVGWDSAVAAAWVVMAARITLLVWGWVEVSVSLAKISKSFAFCISISSFFDGRREARTPVYVQMARIRLLHSSICKEVFSHVGDCTFCAALEYLWTLSFKSCRFFEQLFKEEVVL
ncbi:hypothetical protein CDAR_298661 [Caerostris darwini]|uniref:Uncharacterized protein n=1 Tax=Caerostris darwini TaxID=1538125 RepID=A0AAV4MU54_9ARAC|nr:hypothetical protein CDAR_298661 [Caerostris darwini]